MAGVRLVVRAKPGSRKESVTVAALEGESEVVVVRVRARAVDGAANTAVVKAVAAALGVRRTAITMTVGTRSRTKHLDIDADPQHVAAAVAALPRDVSP